MSDQHEWRNVYPGLLRQGEGEALNAAEVANKLEAGITYLTDQLALANSDLPDALEAQLAESLSQRQAAVEELALQRKQLRNAWAKLKCRCIFNDEDEKTAEDLHCAYHGWQQRDPDGWDPIGDLETERQAAVEERDEANRAYAFAKSELHDFIEEAVQVKQKASEDRMARRAAVEEAEREAARRVLAEREVWLEMTERLERELAAANQDAALFWDLYSELYATTWPDDVMATRAEVKRRNAALDRLASQPRAEAEGA